jgi:putative oxidoreductase
MALIRRLARPLLASTFIYGGIDAFRHPEAKAPSADKVVADLPSKLPAVTTTAQLVRVDAAAKIVGGIALGAGKFPRLAALGLAASLVPTTLAGHRFWEEQDAAKRNQQLLQFLKNASILGGVLLAAVDTEGRPSLGWRIRRRAGLMGADAGNATNVLAQSVGDAAGTVSDAAGVVGAAVSDGARGLSGSVRQLAHAVAP